MRLSIPRAFVVVLIAAAGCGSSNSKTEFMPDAAVSAVVQDASQPTDLEIVSIKFDVFTPADTKIDKGLAPDTFAALTPDAAVLPTPDATPDAFVPGPVEPLLVNSGNTAKFDLADGTWKVFSFDTIEGHLYVLGALPDGVEAYVGQSPSVSPFEYIEATNYMRALTFTSSSTGKYYVAVVAKGASVSGAFQIADAGELLEVRTSEGGQVGENKFALTAPNGEASYFYYFSVAPGHDYKVSLIGDAKKPVTLSLSPLADRSTAGPFASPLSSVTGALPITDELVPVASVAKSTSRLYFLYVKVQETVSLTIKVDLAS